jgi:hypothetical protein
MRALVGGIVLLVAGIPMLLVANAHQPEYECHASLRACEHGQALTSVAGRFSESTYNAVQAASYASIALGAGLLIVGAIMLRPVARVQRPPR